MSTLRQFSLDSSAWSGDRPRLRVEQLTYVSNLYAIGVPVWRIADEMHVQKQRIKRLVRTYKLKRDKGRYWEGVSFLSERGEFFTQTDVEDYWVSDMGRVIAMGARPGTVLKPYADKDGYLRVGMWRNGKAEHHLVHRLVAIAFIGSPSDGEVAAHNNGIRDDNRAVNLRWATQKENIADKARHGTDQIGSRHGGAKADEGQILALKSALRAGFSIRDAATFCGVTYNIAADVSRGRTWRHVR